MRAGAYVSAEASKQDLNDPHDLDVESSPRAAYLASDRWPIILGENVYHMFMKFWQASKRKFARRWNDPEHAKHAFSGR
jgi:hypothetical protein